MPTMTLPSQFSLEEENFYKDIQDLVKKGSQNEKELSTFLERYMDLLARADLDDESFIINFTKAGLIIEASAKVYGTKVDKLWINLEHVLESLKNKNQNQILKKKTDCEEEVGNDFDIDGNGEGLQEEGRRKLPNVGRRRKKLGDALFSSDDFMEIDNITGLLEKNMNENFNASENKMKLCAKVPNMFIKNKTKKKKIDVCLNKCLEDKDVIRLRDWIILLNGLLIKDLYTPIPENYNSSNNLVDFSESDVIKDHYENSEIFTHGDNISLNVEEDTNLINSKESEKLIGEKNNNSSDGVSVQHSPKEPETERRLQLSEKDDLLNDLNVSRESDLAKFPNVLDRLSGDCLVDVDEVFWNSSKFQDVISSKKMRAGKTFKLPCQLCSEKKELKKKGRRIMEEKKMECLDTFFTPHVQPTLSEPHCGILPDEELYNAFKIEMKLIGHLGKANTCKNINEAYHPDESPEELRNFLGFDGFENYLMKRVPEFQEELSEENLMVDPLEDDNENYVEDSVPCKEFELPFPVTEASVKATTFPENDLERKSIASSEDPVSDYQKLVIEELKDHYAAKSSFERNKELGMKISKWHEMIADKIKLSQKRGALNMNILAEKIMHAFPAPANGERPVLSFRDLVKNQSKRDIPRYFFACLQLTNEGNLNIGKSNSLPLTTDCMMVTQLKTTRINYELEDYSVKTSANREVNSPDTVFSQTKRKRNSLSNSSSTSESENQSKKKRMKQAGKSNKRPKNCVPSTDSKKRRC